jgi:mevalonate kinase
VDRSEARGFETVNTKGETKTGAGRLTPPSETTDVVARDAGVLAEGFGHAKIILLGEHAVVYDEPALAGGLAAGLHAFAVAGRGRLVVPAWGVDVTAVPALAGAAGSSVSGAAAVACALAAIFDRVGGWDLDFHVSTDIPAGAGLGSSAALAAAVARAAAAVQGADEVAVRAAVDAAETVFHGTASGIDAAAALGGGVGRFTRAGGWKPLALAAPLSLCVGLSPEPRNTRDLVRRVRELRERSPVSRKIIGLLGELVTEAETALARSDLAALGRLFDLGHGLLASLGVSSAGLEALVHVARAAGADGAKLTGAGGGGAVIALAPGREQTIVDRWKAAGFTGFVTHLGGT